MVRAPWDGEHGGPSQIGMGGKDNKFKFYAEKEVKSITESSIEGYKWETLYKVGQFDLLGFLLRFAINRLQHRCKGW